MSVRVVQVDESEKDEPGVEKAVTTIAGRTIETYARLERVDDIDGKTTDGVVEIEMLVPVLDEDAGEDDAYVFNRAIIDLGHASLKKYLKAIEPFADRARMPLEEAVPEVKPAARRAPSTSSAAKNAQRKAWNHRAKEWFRKTGVEFNEHGRIPAHLEAIYVENHPKDPKPE